MQPNPRACAPWTPEPPLADAAPSAAPRRPAHARTTLEPQRFYVPRLDADATASTARHRSRAQPGWSPATAPKTAPHRPQIVRGDVEVAGRNVITCSSASGGVGTTTHASMLAQALGRRHAPTALVDLDLRVAGGGLDVMLGLEHEQGARWHDVRAPLGQLNGPALHRQLPQWEDVGVLSYNPWHGEGPKPWEVQAAVAALALADEVVVADVGRGEPIERAAILVEASHVVFAELSVLGLARAQTHIEWLDRVGRRSVEQRATPPGIGQEIGPMAAVAGRIVAVVGVEPAGAVRGRGVVSVQEAREYLDREVIGPIRGDGRLCGDVLEGLGIRGVPRRNQQVLEELTTIVERACALDRRGGR